MGRCMNARNPCPREQILASIQASMGTQRRFCLLNCEDAEKWKGHEKIAYDMLQPGAKWDHYKCYAGELPPIPTLDRYDVVFITGSHYSAYEQREWIIELAEWLNVAVRVQPGVRFLGLCFGCQILALGMGGLVGKNPSGRFVLKVEEIHVSEELQADPAYAQALEDMAAEEDSPHAAQPRSAAAAAPASAAVSPRRRRSGRSSRNRRSAAAQAAASAAAPTAASPVAAAAAAASAGMGQGEGQREGGGEGSTPLPGSVGRREWPLGSAPTTSGTPALIRLIQSHGDQVLEIPEGAIRLAKSETATFEVWGWGGNVLAIQGHPELNGPMVMQKIHPAVTAAGRLTHEESVESAHSLITVHPDSQLVIYFMRRYVEWGLACSGPHPGPDLPARQLQPFAASAAAAAAQKASRAAAAAALARRIAPQQPAAAARASGAQEGPPVVPDYRAADVLDDGRAAVAAGGAVAAAAAALSESGVAESSATHLQEQQQRLKQQQQQQRQQELEQQPQQGQQQQRQGRRQGRFAADTAMPHAAQPSAASGDVSSGGGNVGASKTAAAAATHATPSHATAAAASAAAPHAMPSYAAAAAAAAAAPHAMPSHAAAATAGAAAAAAEQLPEVAGAQGAHSQPGGTTGGAEQDAAAVSRKAAGLEDAEKALHALALGVEAQLGRGPSELRLLQECNSAAEEHYSHMAQVVSQANKVLQSVSEQQGALAPALEALDSLEAQVSQLERVMTHMEATAARLQHNLGALGSSSSGGGML